MGLTYERHDTTRLIVVTVAGPLQATDILAMVDRQADEGVWHYSCLYDERLVTTAPSTVDMVPIARYVRELASVHGRRGPVAVVGERKGGVEVYARLSKHFGLQVEVFDEIREAERWLARTSAREPMAR